MKIDKQIFEELTFSPHRNSKSTISARGEFDTGHVISVTTGEGMYGDLNATEFYDLFYSYTNDCLEAAVAFNKSYYIDSDLKPEKQLLFSLTIVPFGKVNTPGFNK